MRKGAIRAINYLSTCRAVWLLAAAACLWPAMAGAQSYNPTATSINGNTAAGTGALPSGAGQFNTAIGGNALSTNTGNNNTASGYLALSANTSGSENTALGALALTSNTEGFQNTASGYRALQSNISGVGNTASGYGALAANTNAWQNTANGYGALASNITGESNTASGSNALYNNIKGFQNSAFGFAALNSNTTGNNNVAVGASALTNMNGSNNIAVGFKAGSRTPSGGSNIYIGHPGISAREDRVTRIGTNQTKIFLAGIAGTPLSGATVVVRSNGLLGVVASSARYKQDIRPLGDASGKLARLRPVSYRYKSEPQATHYGLIAEEVDRVMPELVVRDEQNRPETVQYQELIPLLLQQWKKQQAEIVRQRALIERQEAALRELRQMLATRLAALDAADTGARAGSK